MLLRHDFCKIGYKALENTSPFDLLGGENLRGLEFVGVFMSPRCE